MRVHYDKQAETLERKVKCFFRVILYRFGRRLFFSGCPRNQFAMVIFQEDNISSFCLTALIFFPNNYFQNEWKLFCKPGQDQMLPD
jgi:hypothetical protein